MTRRMGLGVAAWAVWMVLGTSVFAQEAQVADTRFDPDRGFYTDPFDLVLSTDTPGATIWYTLDGRSPLDAEGRPSSAAQRYTGPLTVATTTVVRAAAVLEGMLPTNVDSQTYLFLADVIHFDQNQALAAGYPDRWFSSYPADYGMDPEVVDDPDYRDLMQDALLSIPTVSLVTDPGFLFNRTKDPATGGIYIYTGHGSTGGADWERPASVEFFDRDGDLDLHANCGIRIQGGENRNPSKCPKHGFSLRFRREYGTPRLRADLFDGPVDSFDSLQLRGFFNNSWIHWSAQQGRNAQYLRDQWMRDSMIAMGHADGGRGRFVHLYLNGMYWGLYNLHERPVADHYAQYNGGDEESLDAINGGTPTDGTSAAWQGLQGTVASGDWSAIQGVLDVNDFVDWTLLNLYGGNQDLKSNGNWRAAGGGPEARPWHFYPWDSERTLENVNQSLGTRPSSDPTGLLSPLQKLPAFVTRFGDRVRRHLFHGGALTPEACAARWRARAAEIDLAVIAESARWGDYRRDVHVRYSPGYLFTRNDYWLPEQQRLLTQYFPGRTGVLLGQLTQGGLYPRLAAPEFLVAGVPQHGGHLLATDPVALEASAGEIRYTRDGRDPQGRAGDVPVGPSVVVVSDQAAKRILVPQGAVDDAWQGGAPFDDSAWIAGQGGVGYEHSSGYDPYFDVDVEDAMYRERTSCFLRVPFVLSSLEPGAWARLRLRVRYDDGFVAFLNGREIARANAPGNLTWQSSATNTHSDSAAVQWIDFDVSAALDALRLGDNVLALQGLNASTTSSDFLLAATLVAQEAVPVDPGQDDRGPLYDGPFLLDRSRVLKARAFDGQSWSALTEAVFAVGPVAESLRISEIMYHPLDTGDPNDPNAEYVELVNVGDVPVNLARVRFVRGLTYDFGPVTLAPGEVGLLVRDAAVAAAHYGPDLPILGTYTGKLSNGGETLALADAAGEVFLSFRYRDDWHRTTDGEGASLELLDPRLDPTLLEDAAVWRPRPGGTPGFLP